MPDSYYELNISHPDDETHVQMITADKKLLREFFNRHAHEAGAWVLFRHFRDGTSHRQYEISYDEIAGELEFDSQ
jgi:hypothetical protein